METYTKIVFLPFAKRFDHARYTILHTRYSSSTSQSNYSVIVIMTLVDEKCVHVYAELISINKRKSCIPRTLAAKLPAPCQIEPYATLLDSIVFFLFFQSTPGHILGHPAAFVLFSVRNRPIKVTFAPFRRDT